MLKGCVNEAVEGAGMCLQSGLCCSGGGGGGRLVSDSTIAMGGKGGVIQLPGSEDAGKEPSALCPSSALLFFPFIPQIFIERLL